MKSCERERTLAGAARLIRSAQRLEAEYAGAGAPVGAAQLDRLLRGSGCHVESYPFASDAVAMLLPRCDGAYPVLLNQNAERGERSLALRHELAHVLAGDADGALFLPGEGYMAPEERAADLFALADLVPGWWMAELRAAGEPWRTVLAEVTAAMADFSARWPTDRVRDRAMLRLRLWAARGV